MKITFVRHGETGWNIQNKLQGQTNDSMLTNKGIYQANNLANKLSDYTFDIIISSPLERAFKTAQIINSKIKKQLILEDNLKERGYGILEGECAQSGHYNMKKLWDYKMNYSDKEVEPVQEFFKRIYKFLDNLIQENKYKNVLIVSHSGVGITLRTYFEGFPEDGDLLKFGIENCQILEYNTIVHKNINIESLNKRI